MCSVADNTITNCRPFSILSSSVNIVPGASSSGACWWISRTDLSKRSHNPNRRLPYGELKCHEKPSVAVLSSGIHCFKLGFQRTGSGLDSTRFKLVSEYMLHGTLCLLANRCSAWKKESSFIWCLVSSRTIQDFMQVIKHPYFFQSSSAFFP